MKNNRFENIKVGNWIKIFYGANSYGRGRGWFKVTEISAKGNVYGEVWKADKSYIHNKRRKLTEDVLYEKQ